MTKPQPILCVTDQTIFFPKEKLPELDALMQKKKSEPDPFEKMSIEDQMIRLVTAAGLDRESAICREMAVRCFLADYKDGNCTTARQMTINGISVFDPLLEELLSLLDAGERDDAMRLLHRNLYPIRSINDFLTGYLEPERLQRRIDERKAQEEAYLARKREEEAAAAARLAAEEAAKKAREEAAARAKAEYDFTLPFYNHFADKKEQFTVVAEKIAKTCFDANNFADRALGYFWGNKERHRYNNADMDVTIPLYFNGSYEIDVDHPGGGLSLPYRVTFESCGMRPMPTAYMTDFLKALAIAIVPLYKKELKRRFAKGLNERTVFTVTASYNPRVEIRQWDETKEAVELKIHFHGKAEQSRSTLKGW